MGKHVAVISKRSAEEELLAKILSRPYGYLGIGRRALDTKEAWQRLDSDYVNYFWPEQEQEQ